MWLSRDNKNHLYIPLVCGSQIPQGHLLGLQDKHKNNFQVSCDIELTGGTVNHGTHPCQHTLLLHPSQTLAHNNK